MSLKPGFAQIFSCYPKNLSCPKFEGGGGGGGGAPGSPPPPPPSPLRPPARTPMFPNARKNKTTRPQAEWFQMFSRVWNPDETLALVFEIMFETRTLRNNLQLN